MRRVHTSPSPLGGFTANGAKPLGAPAGGGVLAWMAPGLERSARVAERGTLKSWPPEPAANARGAPRASRKSIAAVVD